MHLSHRLSLLLPALLPNSNVTDVALEWIRARQHDVDTFADSIIDTLTRTRRQQNNRLVTHEGISSGTAGVKTVKYTGDTWNIPFLKNLAERLPDMESVMIENASWEHDDDDDDEFVVRLVIYSP